MKTDGTICASFTSIFFAFNLMWVVWKSCRLWAHLLASYLFTGWTCLMLYMEYSKVEKLRFDFIASQKKRPDQFTVWKLSKTHMPQMSLVVVYKYHSCVLQKNWNYMLLNNDTICISLNMRHVDTYLRVVVFATGSGQASTKRQDSISGVAHQGIFQREPFWALCYTSGLFFYFYLISSILYGEMVLSL